MIPISIEQEKSFFLPKHAVQFSKFATQKQIDTVNPMEQSEEILLSDGSNHHKSTKHDSVSADDGKDKSELHLISPNRLFELRPELKVDFFAFAKKGLAADF